MRLHLFAGFGLGLWLLPMGGLQTHLGFWALGMKPNGCAISSDDAETLWQISGLFLGPWLGMWSGATLHWRSQMRLRAARTCAFVGALTGGALPFWTFATAGRDPEYQTEHHGVWLVIFSVSLPLSWALGLGLFAIFARSLQTDEP